MRTRKHLQMGLGALAAVLAVLPILLVVGCKNGADKPTGAAGEGAQAAFANVRCPIMGSPIDAAKVPDSLVRTHKGRKIAFCCASCPEAWDKLSDAEKGAKLAESVPDTPGHQMRGPGHGDSHEHGSHQ